MRDNVLIDKSIAFAARVKNYTSILLRQRKKQSFPSRSFGVEQVSVQTSMRQTMAKVKRTLFLNSISH